MSTSVTSTAAPALAGAAAFSSPLSDRDLLDDHRLRRARLSEAVRRGVAPPRPGVRWGHLVGGLVLTAAALGGTAVAATVDRALGDRPTATPETPATPATSDRRRAEVSPADPAADDGAGPATTPAVPYAPWAQNRSQTTR